MQPFSILLGLGVLLGLLLIVWRTPEKEASRYLEAGLWVLLCALVGSRAITVVVNFAYYQSHPGEIVQVWLGGLSGIGALAGGILAIIILAIWWKLPAGKLADMLLPLAGTLTIATWIGCQMDSCGYGVPSDTWWALPERDEWGVLSKRVPVQLLGAILTLVILWLLDWTGKHISIPGMNSAIGLLCLSAVIFVLSFQRADPTPMWNGLRLEAWGSIGLMIISLFLVVVLLIRWKIKKAEKNRGTNLTPGR